MSPADGRARSFGGAPPSPLEMWAGLECTVNRVGDVYFDQIERNGHARRVEDLDRFAELGITRLRYPVLWERVAPEGVAAADWSWSDQRMERLHALGVRPIVGLVHHGSGPRHTRYPHHRDLRSFVRALLVQCRATVLASNAVVAGIAVVAGNGVAASSGVAAGNAAATGNGVH